jgi:CO/xanthine dehydrogenase FAD-binding subunit
MNSEVSYARADHLEEALQFLWEHGHETTIVAGGTDVLIGLRAAGLRSSRLLDISRLTELKGIGVHGEGLSIGAGVTLAEIYSSEVLARYAPALQKAAFTFGSVQIRNAATIGGNVANASPSADTVPPLLIHGARAVIATINGERSIPVADLFCEPYKTVLRPNEMIARFVLDPAEDIPADFQKIARRQAHAIARISMAVMAAKDEEGGISSLRLALGACTPWPRRMQAVEDLLTGKRPAETIFWEAGRVLAAAMVATTGRRTSTAYKEKAAQGLLFRMLRPLI